MSVNLVLDIDLFDQASVKNAIKELKAFQKWLDSKVEELAERLASLGRDVIGIEYGYDRAESRVSVIKTDNSYIITSSGRSLFILEYGAGDLAGKGEVLGTPPVNTYPGSYSETHAQMYSKHGFWMFGGRKHTEFAPRSGFYYGFKSISENVDKIAREVFSK